MLSPGGCSFLSTPQKGTQKVTAEGTGLPGLALRRREANSHAKGVLRQVPPVAPSLRPNPLRGSLDPNTAALVKRALRNPQPRAVKGHLLFEVYRTELRGPRLEARILVSATTAAKFFAYFFHPRKKVGPGTT